MRELAKPRPALKDTTADLKEIMAFGEESEEGGSDTGALSSRWEPDVSCSCRARCACLVADLH